MQAVRSIIHSNGMRYATCQIMEKQKKNANLPELETVEKSETPTSPAMNWVEKIRPVKCKIDVKL